MTSSLSNLQFRFDSNSAPVLSPDNSLVACFYHKNIILRTTKSWATSKIIPLPNNQKFSSHKAQISHDNKFLAILQAEDNTITVINLKHGKETTITQLSLEQIDHFEWLDISKKHDNDHIILAYSKNGLSMNFYSIKGSSAKCIHTVYKYSSKLLKHPIHDQYTVVLKNGIKNILFNFVIQSNLVHEINSVELMDNSSDIELAHSPQGSWMLVSDVLSSELSIGLYNFLGVGQASKDRIGTGYAFLRLKSSEILLGVSTIRWAVNHRGEESIIAGDHNESLHFIGLKSGLKIEKTISHKSTLNNESSMTAVLEQNYNSTTYIKRSATLLKLPNIENIPLHGKGIHLLAFGSNDSRFIVCTNSMPSVLFLWNMQDLSFPTAIVNAQSPIVSASIGPGQIHKSLHKYVNNVIDNIIIINNGINITIYSPVSQNSLPFLIDVGFDSKILGYKLQEIDIEDGEIVVTLLCWSKNEIKLVSHSISTTTESSSVENYLPVIHTSSSPIHRDETDTRARNIINGVRQAEWGRSSAALMENSDTFMNKKRKVISGDEKLPVIHRY